MSSEANAIVQKAVDSILASDRAKAPDFGGGLFPDVERVDVETDDAGPGELPTLVVRSTTGAEARAVIMPHMIHRPDKRTTAPADVHDATRAALTAAVAELRQ